MKKLLLLIMLAFCLLTFNSKGYTYANSNSYVKVIYTSINAYSETNIAQANVVEIFEYGDKLKLQQDMAIVGEDGYSYFQIETSNGTTAYVFCSQVLLAEIESPKKDLDSNSSVKEDAKVYEIQNQQYKETAFIIKSGNRIKVLDGLDSSKEFTRIQFLDEDGQILTGYVKTTAIQQAGISRGTIGAIIIVVVTISLVLLVFGIKGRKKKKKI